MHSPSDPFRHPTTARGNPLVPQLCQVTVVNDDGTVDVRRMRGRGARTRIPVVFGLHLVPRGSVVPTDEESTVVEGLGLQVGDRVVVEHLDGDPQTPYVSGKL